MECPKCKLAMKKVRWEISNNFKMGDQYKEYDKTTYQCKDDDVWVTIETPIVNENSKSE
jgi:hypothetical protein